MPRIDALTFSGLVRDRDFGDRTFTHNMIVNALRVQGWKERSDDKNVYDKDGKVIGRQNEESGGRVHFVAALRERGPKLGINTLGDLAREMQQGRTEKQSDGRIRRYTRSGLAFVVCNEDEGSLITFTFA